MKSPFKFLDAYDRQDKDIFFGRSEEIDQLYRLIFETDLLLVYGQSGTGKTSLIQCGLANRFQASDWFEVFVRRKDDLNASLLRELRRHAKRPLKENVSVVKAVEALYVDHLRPVYLIFDQFEELFVLGSAAEQGAFIENVVALLAEETLPCKIILVMREEYLAHLQAFERAVPTLFDKRLRVEPMSQRSVERVITGTCAAFGLQIEDGDAGARQIMGQLSDGHAGVQLSYLQVYLDKLYRSALAQPSSQPVVFTRALVSRTGAIGDVMKDFLDEQSAQVQAAMQTQFASLPEDAVQRVLEGFATLEGTKHPLTRAEVGGRLPNFESMLDACLNALVNRRILRDADGHYELAHDSLASHIAQTRSVERANLLKIEKLIRDRLAVHEQTHTYLSKEELEFIAPYRTKLSLDERETTFLTRSQRQVAQGQRRLIGSVLVVSVVIAALAIIFFVEKRRAESTIVAARELAGEIVGKIDDELRQLPRSGEARRKLLGAVADLDKTLGSSADPATRFEREFMGGEIAIDEGDAARAKTHFELAHQVALGHAKDSDPPWLYNLSRTHRALGELRVRAEDDEAALAAFTESLAIARRLATLECRDLWQRNLSNSLAKLGELEREAGRFDKASDYFAEATRAAQAVADAHPDNRQWQDDLSISFRQWAEAQWRLAATNKDEKELGSAKAHFDQAVATARKLTAVEPRNLQWRRTLSAAHDSAGEMFWQLGVSFKDQSRLVLARDAFTQALDGALLLSRADPYNLQWQADLSMLYGKLGEVEGELDKYSEARTDFLEELKIAEQLVKADQSNPAWQRNLMVSQRRLGQAEHYLHHLQEARKAFDNALTTARRAEQASTTEHQRGDWRYEQSVLYRLLGKLACLGHRERDAVDAYARSQAIAEALHRAEPDNDRWGQEFARAKGARASVCKGA